MNNACRIGTGSIEALYVAKVIHSFEVMLGIHPLF